MDQTFTGPVGQVAGRDIINNGPVPYSALSTDRLNSERQHFRALLWAARRRLLLNVPNAVFALVMLALAVYALQMIGLVLDGQFGRTATELPPWLFFGGIMLGVGAPLYFVVKTRQREGAIIFNCKAHLQAIDIALNERGER